MSSRFERFKERMLIVGPPLTLLLVGAAVYIVVVRLSGEDLPVVGPVDQPEVASSTTENKQPTPTQLTNVITEVVPWTKEELTGFQSRADNGDDAWRLDALASAKQLSTEYGFSLSDPFSYAVNSTDKNGNRMVDAAHGGRFYVVTMTQPGKKGATGVWSIASIKLKQ